MINRLSIYLSRGIRKSLKALNFALVVCIMIISQSCWNGHSDFEFTYTMDSGGDYAVSYMFDSHGNYRKEIHNYLMDRMEKTDRSEIKSGKLSKSKMRKFRSLLNNARIPSLDSSYGFNEDVVENNTGLILQVTLKQGKDKYFITINGLKARGLSRGLIQLLESLDSFIQ